MNKEVLIKENFITLNQLLKLTNLFDSGGVIKTYINQEGVFVNNELEYRRGRKLFHNDVVKLQSNQTFIIKTERHR